MSRVEQHLAQFGAHADSFLESCRQGAPVDEVLAQIVTMLAVGRKTIDMLRDSPPQATVKLDVELSDTMRFQLLFSHDAPHHWSAPDDISSLSMVEPSPAQIVTAETDAIFEIADHSQRQLIAVVGTQDGISEPGQQHHRTRMGSPKSHLPQPPGHAQRLRSHPHPQLPSQPPLSRVPLTIDTRGRS
jgi:hypothetical protein